MTQWIVLCLIAYGLLFGLLVLYDLEKSSYTNGIEKLYGYDFKSILREKINEIIVPDLFIYMFIQIVGTFVLCRSLNNYVISFLIKQMMMGLFIIWIMILLIALMTTSFDRQTTLSLLKQKDGERKVLYINQIVLIVLVTISGYLSGNVVHQGNALLSSYKDRHKWESIKGYYIVPTLTNIENQDLFSQ